MDHLLTNLEKMTLQSYGNSNLVDLLRLVGIKPGGVKKAQAVEMLYDFYSDPNSAAKLFQQLNAYEKALLTCIVHSKYRPLMEELKEIAKKYEFNVKSYSYYGYRNMFFPENSKLHAFFVNGQIPELFQDYLEKVIPPYARVFSPCKVEDMAEYSAIIGRESRYKDFDMFLSFINNNKVPATKAGGYINKAALLKFHKIAGYDEICNNESEELEDIRNAGDTVVSFGLIMLLRCADVIDIVQDKFVFSRAASQFVGLSMPEKAKYLFEKYMRHGNRIIDECSRISSAKLKFSRSVYDLSGPRSEIISYLKECPVNEWIHFGNFSKEIHKDNRTLFEVVGSALIRDDYTNQYYESSSWGNFEHCAISVVLMEYLAVLGAVDILAESMSHSLYDAYFAYETAYFRVTDLGAYLFGLTNTYQEKEVTTASGDEKGFIIQPNFDVVIANSVDRMRHELFFDRFAEKIVDDTEVSVYKLDFFGMAKALSIGLMIQEISSYCEAFSNVPLPDNVKSTFLEWEAQSRRVRIRSVTVIETDDHLLLEEISNYKGMNSISEGKISSVLVLTPGSEKRAKGLIEKNKRFCVLEG
ncbi:MAG: helicase-associated domain-containing protein [Methanomicrobiales archaeon]|jgi:hypothetical protein|nr:helicase-associated domain-containing protein [Methanomicrobiales archaeon]